MCNLCMLVKISDYLGKSSLKDVLRKTNKKGKKKVVIFLKSSKMDMYMACSCKLLLWVPETIMKMKTMFYRLFSIELNFIYPKIKSIDIFAVLN